MPQSVPNILDSREDAEECVNDTWHKAWDTMPPQRPGSLRAYLAKITRNLSIDRWRARRTEKRGNGLAVLLDELEECLPAAPSAEEISEARETARAIDRWLDTLSPVDRTAFLRRYWYGQRVDRIAAQAGCSPNSMAKRRPEIFASGAAPVTMQDGKRPAKKISPIYRNFSRITCR